MDEYDILSIKLYKQRHSFFGLFLNYNYINKDQNVNVVAMKERSSLEFTYSFERGILQLSPDKIKLHNFKTAYLELDTDSRCFGHPFLVSFIQSAVGFDLVLLNWAIVAFEGQGHLLNTKTQDLYSLNTAADYIMKKGGKYILTLF